MWRETDKPGQRNLKEKVVLLYDWMLSGEDVHDKNASFWQDFFLLWPNTAYLEQQLSSPETDLFQIKNVIMNFVSNCISIIKEDQHIRAVNALHTLSVIVRSVAKKHALGYDSINLLFGFDRAEKSMQMLLERVCQFITEKFPATLKSFSLRLLLSMITAVDNVNENNLLEYYLINSVFEAVIQLLVTSSERAAHGRDAVLLLTLLVNYRKSENVNQYIVKLSILDNELALNGYSQVISGALSLQNKVFRDHLQNLRPSGFFSNFSNMIGGWLVGEDATTDNVTPDLSMLLALYEAIHLNRNFVTNLTTAPTDTNNGQFFNSETNNAVAGSGDKSMDLPDLTCSTNLLTSFLTYFSIMQQYLKSERCQNAAKLCSIVLTCITEDQYANTLMHDVNMAFKVPLFYAPMRHRKGTFDDMVSSCPLACSVLKLCTEFTLSHLMRNFPVDLYMRVLGIMHRILCFEKKCRMRLDYAWRSLWNGLIHLIKFIVSQEQHLLQTKIDIFAVCHRVLVIMNLFITYGDTFLPSPASYDELYYEIIRSADAFNGLYSLLLRHGSSDGVHKEVATKLCSNMVNIRAIVTHFQTKIDETGNAMLNEQEILEIVRKNYDTLTLKLQENLDGYERYHEQPRETSFFVNTVKAVVTDVRERLQNTTLDYQMVLSELSTIK